MVTRPMQPADVDAASAASAAAFEVDLSDPESARGWRDRIAWPLETDPGGAFVAERDGRVIGVAQALRRERLWCLSLLTIDPTVQSAGAGRALMDAAIGYDERTDAGLIVSSNDPRAMRLYARAGFRLLPTVKSVGNVERSKLRSTGGSIRDGGLGDLEELDAISREVRGAPHTAEIAFALGRGGRLLRVRDRGFVVVHPEWGVWLLVARDDETAAALLWGAIGSIGDVPRALINWVTADQQWAIEVAVAAGLGLKAYGALCVRGNPGPLRPFIPSGAFA